MNQQGTELKMLLPSLFSFISHSFTPAANAATRVVKDKSGNNAILDN